MRSPIEVDWVRDLVEKGLNDCAIARLTQLPRGTVRDWRASKRWQSRSPIPGISRHWAPGSGCPECGGPRHDLGALPDTYAYLLGMYLGDGCLSKQRRGVMRLRIALDERYPGIIRECFSAMQDLLPENTPHVQKLHRRIALTDWQEAIVNSRPDLLLRGLIHSDGCRSLNIIHHPKKTYSYPRYQFSNRSDDIRGIFCDACDLLGIECRVMNRWNISVARRESVARMDEFVGPKA